MYIPKKYYAGIEQIGTTLVSRGGANDGQVLLDETGATSYFGMTIDAGQLNQFACVTVDAAQWKVESDCSKLRTTVVQVDRTFFDGKYFFNLPPSSYKVSLLLAKAISSTSRLPVSPAIIRSDKDVDTFSAILRVFGAPRASLGCVPVDGIGPRWLDNNTYNPSNLVAFQNTGGCLFIDSSVVYQVRCSPLRVLIFSNLFVQGANETAAVDCK